MPRRVIASVAAGLLALVGAAILLSYVSGADARAMAGLDAVEVLVVTKIIPEGTPADELKGLVRSTPLPATAVMPGALVSLDAVDGQVAMVELLPGEQLVAERFGSADALVPAGTVEVPDGLQEVSILLESQRVLGGQIAAGDEVGVMVSLTDPSRTALTLDRALVVRVDGGSVATSEAGTDAAEVAPEGNVLVTFALAAHDAEQLVFGMEHGTVWLSRQNDTTTSDGAAVVTSEDVYQ